MLEVDKIGEDGSQEEERIEDWGMSWNEDPNQTRGPKFLARDTSNWCKWLNTANGWLEQGALIGCNGPSLS